MQDEQQQINQLLKQVLPMETQQAFAFLERSEAPDTVVNQVALLLSPSTTRTLFLEHRGLLGQVSADVERQDLSGQHIDHIRFIKPLGQGGMGSVYLAEDTRLQRQVAVKALHKNHQISEAVQERFRREALILSQLDHPNICRIHQLLEAESNDYLVLELVGGNTLDAAAFKRLARPQKFNVAFGLLRALQAAHAKNIIHRDIKPDNIMLDDQGQVKVLDFGISRLSEGSQSANERPGTKTVQSGQTMAGVVMGTLTYMSPEQAAGEEVTTASDVYSLGLVFQELFSNTPVYQQGLTAEQLLQHSSAAQTQKPVDLPHDLEQLIERMKARSPAERPTAIEAIAVLQRIQQKPVRRLRWLIAASVLLLAGLGISKHIIDLNHEREQADLARAQAEQVTAFMTSIFTVSNPYLEHAPELTAEQLLDRGAQRLDDELRDQPELKALLKATMGDVYHVMGELDQAQALLQDAYQQVQQNPAFSPQNKATITSMFATLVMDQGDYALAEQLFNETLNWLPPNSEAALKNMNWLVLIHNRLNQYEQGLAMTATIRQAMNRQPGFDPNILIDALNAEGMMLQGTGDLAAAEQRFTEALQQADHHEGADFSTRVNLLGNLAGVYIATGRDEDSLRLRQQVVTLSEEQLPENHPDLIGHYDNLAVDYYYLDDLEQARFWNKRSLDVFAALAAGNPEQNDDFDYSYNMTLANYGVLLTRSEQWQEAKTVFTDVVNNFSRLLGEQHKTVADYVYDLARVSFQLGEYDQAERLVTRALAIHDQIDVPHSSREVKTWLLKAKLLHHQQDLAALQVWQQQVMDWLQSAEPVNEDFIALAEEQFAEWAADLSAQ